MISGERDLLTPPPVGQRIADLATHSVLPTVPGMGHSAMDTQQHIALHVSTAIANGETHPLPEQVTDLDPRRSPNLVAPPAIKASIRVDRIATTAQQRLGSPGRRRRGSTNHAGTDQ